MSMQHFFLVRAIALLSAALMLVGCASQPQPSLPAAPSAAVRTALAPSGTLRAAINFGNPILASKDAASGLPRGVSVDMAQELGKRLGVPVELVTYTAAGRVVEGIKSGEWDIAFYALDPVRMADTDFSAAYVVIEGAYLVPQTSPIQKNADVDQDGVRVVVGGGSAYDLFLTRELKKAKIVRAATSPAVTDMMVTDKIEVAAGVRQQLEADAKRLLGLRLLDGRFMTINQAMAVPKGNGREAGAAYVRQFVEEMKTSGFVAAALKRHGIEGAAVAAAHVPIPDTEVFLASLDLAAATIRNPRNITRRQGYDNQPAFVNDGRAILFVSDQPGTPNIYRHDINTGVTTAVTATKESLYSPMPLADGTGFSAIRVVTPNANGAESNAPPVWRFGWDGKPVEAMTDVRVVGYYTWINHTQAALFVVDDDAKRNAHKLVLTDSATGKTTLLTNHPGRSLGRTADGRRAVFVDKSDPKRWVVAAMGAMDARPAVLIDTPVGPAGEPNGTQETDRSEDFCWLPDGALLMAQGSKFLRWDGRPRSGFKLFADLGELGGQIKRIAVSRDGTQLAFVVQQHAKNP